MEYGERFVEHMHRDRERVRCENTTCEGKQSSKDCRDDGREGINGVGIFS